MQLKPLLSSCLFTFCCLTIQAQTTDTYTEPSDPQQAVASDWTNVATGLNASWASRDKHYALHKVPLKSLVKDTTIYAWRGERLGAEAVLFSKTATGNLRLTLSDWTKDGTKAVDAANGTATFMNYVITDQKRNCGANDKSTATSLVADIIDNSSERSLSAMSTRPVWCTFNVPADLAAGTYDVTLTVTDVTAGSTVATLPIHIVVDSHALPAMADRTFHVDFWQQPYAVSRWYNTGRWTQAHFDALRPYLTRLAQSGQRVVSTILFYEPWGDQSYDKFDPMIKSTKKADGTWKYDYTIFDHYVMLCDSVGINSQINCYSMVPWDMTFRYYDESQGKEVSLKTTTGSSDYSALWTPFLQAFAKHLKEKGWYDKTCIAMDERSLADMTNAYNVLQAAVPGMKMALAGNYHQELVDKIYDYCIAFGQTFSASDLQTRHAKGYISTCYTSCADAEPNIFTNSNPYEAAFLPLYAVASGLDGYLHWSWMNWDNHPLTDSRYRLFPPGDTYSVYPGNRSSVRYERFIEGVQNAEKYAVLKKEYTENNETSKLTALTKAVSDCQDGIATAYRVSLVESLLNGSPAPVVSTSAVPDTTVLYRLTNSRGSLYYNPASEYVWSTGKQDVQADAANYDWAFVPAGDNTYYIYNVGHKRFIAPYAEGTYNSVHGGMTWKFTTSKVAVRVNDMGTGKYSICTADDNTYMSVSNSYDGPLISYYAVGDGGVPFDFSEDGTVSDAIRADIASIMDGSPLADAVVMQGYQTTGLGNKNSVLLKVKLPATASAIALTSVDLTLKDNTLANIDSIKVFTSSQDNFPADSHPVLVGQVKPASNAVSVPLSGATTATSASYLYITVNVKPDATLGAMLDATLDRIGEKDRTDTLNADPDYAQRIYAVQQFLGMPDTYGSHYYRIPAMVVAKDGSIVTAYDKRFASLGDAGSHRIDLVSRRSTDGGKTWSEPLTIAEGKGAGGFSNGFGDPALVVTSKGRIICMSCAGDKGFFNGQKDMAMIYSDDNGVTWSEPVNITDYHLNNLVDGKQNALLSVGFFVTSGRGIVNKDGRVMFAANYRQSSGKIVEYVIYSDDEGETWTLDNHAGYTGADESKLLLLNDGRLMMSIRQAGSRGFNTTKGENLVWGYQYRNAQVSGAACNADILYYNRDLTGKNDIILHTIPATIPSLQRANLQLLASRDGGQNWSVIDTLQAGAASYSTMDRLPDGSLAIFYEDESNGVNNWTMNFITLTREQVEAMAARVDTTVSQDEKEHNAAMAQLHSGALYTISATVDGKTWYLQNSGAATDDSSLAGRFTVGTVTGGDIFREGIRIFSPNAYYTFTNPDWSNGSIINHDVIRTELFTKNDRVTYDAQLPFFNGEHFAVRATNANDASWGASSFWTITDGKAAYTETERPYIWDFNEVMPAPNFEADTRYVIHSITDDKFFSAGTTAAIALDADTAAAAYTIEPSSEYNTVQVNLFYVRDTKTGMYVNAPLNGSSDKPWVLSTTPSPVMINVAGEVQADNATQYYLSSTHRDVASFTNGATVVNHQPSNTTYTMKDETVNWLITKESDLPTAIRDLTSSTVHPSPAYNLSGQRVTPSFKGLVVTKGKKVVRQ